MIDVFNPGSNVIEPNSQQMLDDDRDFRFLNAERFGTIRVVQLFNRFPLATARNRLQNAV